MKVHATKQIIFEINDEQKDFLDDLSEFCSYIKIQFSERDEEYQVTEKMK